MPFEEPVSAICVGYVDGQYVVNPSVEEQKTSTLELLVSGTVDGVTMIESKASELTEDEMIEAVQFAHEFIVKML